MTDFRPGFLYGFVASSILLGQAELTRRRSAVLVVLPSMALLVLSLIAWRLLAPLADAAQGGSWPAVLAETVAAIVFVGGLEGLFYNMVPLTFMDGAVVYRWNPIVWAALFGLATFLFWQLVINQYASYLNAFQNIGVLVCLAMLTLYGAVALGTWAFFRYRRRGETRPA